MGETPLADGDKNSEVEKLLQGMFLTGDHAFH
jgi:hypothetical protein